jgi:iron complex outermembrane receptor protein
VLKNLQFVGPNAQVIPFNTGFTSGSNCYSCSANVDSSVTNQSPSAVPYHNYNLFSYTSYKLTDSITASLMLNYGWNAENNIANNGRSQNYTIQIDNAFIPDSIRQQMLSQGIQTLTLGSTAMGNLINHRQVSMASLGEAVGQNYVQNYRQLYRGVFTLTGAYSLLGEDWSWEAYAQNSSVRERQWARLNTFNVNLNNAVDSVVVQASGPDSLGGGNAATATQIRSILTKAGVPIPAVGSIACRSTLTQTLYGTTANSAGYQIIQPGGLAPGCAPLNLFGEGVTSQAALNYVSGRTNDAVADQALYSSTSRCSRFQARARCPGGFRPARSPWRWALKIGWSRSGPSAIRCNWARPVCLNRAISPSFLIL